MLATCHTFHPNPCLATPVPGVLQLVFGHTRVGETLTYLWYQQSRDWRHPCQNSLLCHSCHPRQNKITPVNKPQIRSVALDLEGHLTRKKGTRFNSATACPALTLTSPEGVPPAGVKTTKRRPLPSMDPLDSRSRGSRGRRAV